MSSVVQSNAASAAWKSLSQRVSCETTMACAPPAMAELPPDTTKLAGAPTPPRRRGEG